MYNLKSTARKFWCLEGFVAIIITIFAISALLNGRILGAILMSIFSYWWLKRVLSKSGGSRNGSTNYHGNRDLDL
jgi:hypothetical protein